MAEYNADYSYTCGDYHMYARILSNNAQMIKGSMI